MYQKLEIQIANFDTPKTGRASKLYNIPGHPKLKVEVMKSGRRYFKLYYFDSSKMKHPKYLTLGEFPYMGLEEAISEAQKLLKEQISNKFMPSKVVTLDECFKEFVKNVDYKTSTLSAYKKRFATYCGSLSHVKIGHITLVEIKSILNKAKTDTTRLKLYYILKNVLSYAEKQGYLPHSPLDDFNFSKSYTTPSKTEQTHHPILQNPSDIAAFLQAAMNDKRLNFQKKAMIIFALETGLRTMNLMNAKWSYVDWEKGQIVFPKEKMKGEKRTEKGRQDFILPLSETMLDLLKALRTKSKRYGENYIFEGISEQNFNQKLKQYGGVTKHGLRGTLRTHLAKRAGEHRMSSEVIKLYTYHAPNGRDEIERAYVHLSYKDEEIQAQLRVLANWWDGFLLSLFDFKTQLLEEGE